MMRARPQKLKVKAAAMICSVVVCVLLPTCAIHAVATAADAEITTGAPPFVRAGTDSIATDITSTATTGAESASAGCSGVMQCLDNPSCAQCLLAINRTAGFPHTLAVYNSLGQSDLKAVHIDFFQTLQSTASCSIFATSPIVFFQLLEELNDVDACIDEYGMHMSSCLAAEYACFADPRCRICLTGLYDAIENDKEALTEAVLSPTCVTTNITVVSQSFLMQVNLATVCAGTFPACTLFKEQCKTSLECSSCLSTFEAGNGAAAARQCPVGKSAAGFAMTSVMSCVSGTNTYCAFMRQSCFDQPHCGTCLGGMTGESDNLHAVAAEWSALACQESLRDPVTAFFLLSNTACPGNGACRIAMAACAVQYGNACISCFNGSILSPEQAALCSVLTQKYSFETQCQSCPASVHTINLLALATATVGGASTVACLTVVATILAHSHDRVSMRSRIVIGLMLANVIYSTANAIPLNALRTDALSCGRLAMSFEGIRFGRAWWFCGKYGLVGFELFILGASIQALLRGSSVSARTEIVMHLACVTFAVLAFAVFYALCDMINDDGYNTSTENAVYANSYQHLGADDEIDDVTPSLIASSIFQSERDVYDNLVRDMLIAWDVLVALAICMWAVLRCLHWYLQRALRAEEAAASQAQASDEWIETRRSAWEEKHRFLRMRREMFDEVASPLEPYIAIFVLFAPPAFVMSTTFCQEHSGASLSNGGDVLGIGASSNFSYGTCDVWCEFVLAFRSLCTVAIYLMPHERRVEFVALRSTWRHLCVRVSTCIACIPVVRYALVRNKHGDWHNPMYEAEESDSLDDAEHVIDTPAWHINKHDITIVRRLGAGAYGEVWEGVLQPHGRRVAIKILHICAIDEDGDLIDPEANENFRKECAAMQCVSSPHLLSFFGFGTTEEGNGFIVTELMSGGSLDIVLRNHEHDLPWSTRLKIGLQVAFGMEYLHQKCMLHRDLKSANVLLNEDYTTAKVGDFGMLRIVKPTPMHVVHCPFTGVTKWLPRNDSELGRGHSVLSLMHMGLIIEDEYGTMTKAAGTLSWMAPEVFRGDRHYTTAVDVYSFGILMWELATGEIPWSQLAMDFTMFFTRLNRALQKGRRPIIPAPVVAHHRLFAELMQRCWASDPADRPAFSEVKRELAQCLRSDNSLSETLVSA